MRPSKREKNTQAPNDVPPAIRKIIADAYHSVINSSSSFKSANNSNQIQIGCEHEFFLTDQEKAPCSLEKSQEFLLKLSKLPNWKVFRSKGDSGKYIFRVSFDLSDGTYHSVKYEHPPHLLELAIAPSKSLLQFRERIFRLWSDISEAANQSQLNFLSTPFLSPPQMNWDEIALFGKNYVDLKRSREFMVEPCDVLESWVHFPTYTAATQFHIGNFDWWKSNDRLIEKLYRAELAIGGDPYNVLTKNTEDQMATFKQRWENYLKVFKNSELVGFPKFKEWSIDRWIRAFANSSLIVDPAEGFEGKTLSSILIQDINFDVKPLLRNVRDLQIIKPKLIGTLEFRADPALPTPELITNQAAMRFGTFLLCLKKHSEPFKGISYSEISARWWDGLNLKGVEKEAGNIKEIIWQSLRERNLGEEGLL